MKTFNITAHRKTFRGLIAHSLQRQRQRKHGVTYTREEFLNWCLENDQLIKLYVNWQQSFYKKELRPTIDRIDPLKPYSLNNIQALTYTDNVKKGNFELIKTKGKRVLQVKLDKVVAEFDSIKEAALKTGINASNICNALKGRQKTTKGFRWAYGL